MKRHGLDVFRRSILQIAPYLGDRVEELKDWDQIKLLTVQINRLRRWSRPGLLCIGDAAHAMSPAGGIGINLAIQDAVATANLLADALRERRLTDALLARVQRRREFPTRLTQAVQVNAHKGFEYVFRHPGRIHAPWQMRLAFRIPGVQRLIAASSASVFVRSTSTIQRPARRRRNLTAAYRRVCGYSYGHRRRAVRILSR